MDREKAVTLPLVPESNVVPGAAQGAHTSGSREESDQP